jgi:hypothetical protein
MCPAFKTLEQLRKVCCFDLPSLLKKPESEFGEWLKWVASEKRYDFVQRGVLYRDWKLRKSSRLSAWINSLQGLSELTGLTLEELKSIRRSDFTVLLKHCNLKLIPHSMIANEWLRSKSTVAPFIPQQCSPGSALPAANVGSKRKQERQDNYEASSRNNRPSKRRQMEASSLAATAHLAAPSGGDEDTEGFRELRTVSLVASASDTTTGNSPPSVVTSAPSAKDLKVQEKIKMAFAEWRAMGVLYPTVRQVSCLSGYGSATTAYFTRNLSLLLAMGIIKKDARGRLYLSEAGLEARFLNLTPMTNAEILARILEANAKIFQGTKANAICMLLSDGKARTAEDLSKALGLSCSNKTHASTTSSFTGALSLLRERQLIEQGIFDKKLRLSDIFFPEKRLAAASRDSTGGSAEDSSSKSSGEVMEV